MQSNAPDSQSDAPGRSGYQALPAFHCTAALGQTGNPTLAARMPGRVVAVPVERGTAVERGQPLVVLEAMKMEIPVMAPRAGTVKTVLVEEKQQVAEGQPLVILQF